MGALTFGAVLADRIFLTDGGLETTLIFIDGYELPCFAAFDLLKREDGYRGISKYYRQYLHIARDVKANFILETPTWRANPDWIEKVGYPASAIEEVNEQAVKLVKELKVEFANDIDTILISGCIGPRGDGYRAEHKMSVEQAKDYHSAQAKIFHAHSVDMISAITINYVEEAIGIAQAAEAVGLPSVISFTVETDGKLVTGSGLKEAIEQVDSSVDTKPLYYMINCAHPAHFMNELIRGKDEPWLKRVKGIRANASCKSHAELDESTELDRGNPAELASDYKQMQQSFPWMNVFGGCCGTDNE
ncbi:MAG: homocysteine S-methyltransferase, partial [Sphingomonadales bacterium]